MQPNKLLLRASWGGRVDSMERQVAMVWDCWQRWAALGGSLTQGWVSLNTSPEQFIHLPSLAALEADMQRAYEAGSGGYYRFLQYGEPTPPIGMPQHLLMSVSMVAFEGGDRMAANNVVVDIWIGDITHLEDPQPVGWLLGLGPRLVKDFVDVWQPDAVSLDSRELIRLYPHQGSAHPMVGYFTWLGPLMVDPAVLPDTPVRESYAGGTLFGIDPATEDPVGDAKAIALPLYQSSLLHPIPFIQGQPNSTPAVQPGHGTGGHEMETLGRPLLSYQAVLKYRVKYTPKPGSEEYVDFDDHFWDGDPPVEYFKTMKQGYWVHLFEELWPGDRIQQLAQFEDQAERQLFALQQHGYEGPLDWHFSDQEVANLVKTYFERHQIDVVVYFDPDCEET